MIKHQTFDFPSDLYKYESELADCVPDPFHAKGGCRAFLDGKEIDVSTGKAVMNLIDRSERCLRFEPVFPANCMDTGKECSPIVPIGNRGVTRPDGSTSGVYSSAGCSTLLEQPCDVSPYCGLGAIPFTDNSKEYPGEYYSPVPLKPAPPGGRNLCHGKLDLYKYMLHISPYYTGDFSFLPLSNEHVNFRGVDYSIANDTLDTPYRTDQYRPPYDAMDRAPPYPHEWPRLGAGQCGNAGYGGRCDPQRIDEAFLDMPSFTTYWYVYLLIFIVLIGVIFGVWYYFYEKKGEASWI